MRPENGVRRRGPSAIIFHAASALGVVLAISLMAWPVAAATGNWPPDSSRVQRPEPSPFLSVLARADAGHPRLGAFAAGQPDWWVAADPTTGSVARAYGPGLLLPAGDDGDVGSRVSGLLTDWPGLIGVAAADLGPPRLLQGARTPDAVRWLRLEQNHLGLPVLDASFTVAVKEGLVTYVGSRLLGPVSISAKPALDASEALAALVVSTGAPDLIYLKEPDLAFAPVEEASPSGPRVGHRLVWRMLVLPAGAEVEEAYHARVDAHTGDIIALYPDVLNAACEAEPRQLQGVVRGGIRPNRADDTEESRVFPSVLVTAEGVDLVTDLNGTYPYSGGASGSALQGAHFPITCFDCNIPPLAPGDGGGDIDFGSGGASLGVPVTGNGTSTPADRNAFYHLEQAHQLLNKWNAVTFPEIVTRVNIQQFCNASSGSFRLNFFKQGTFAGNTCNNTGEIRDVMQHELGHTWDRTDGNDITDGGMSEWKGDLLAIFMSGDSCIGESFFISPLSSFPTTGCSGVRDIDEKAPGRQDQPLTPAQCPTCATLTRTSNGCGGSVHCLGQIPGQALWHLKNNLLAGVDYISGASMGAGNPALSAEQAEWLLERLFLAGGAPMENWSPTAPGVSIYDVIMVQDDDDANLANGTPHAAYINAAFAHHEIAETPTIGDSANCAAPADPLVTPTLETHPLTGRPRVRLDWSGGGSPVFNVYRNWGAGDAFLPVATAVAGGPVFDDNVGVGESLNYLVAAVGTGACAMISPGTNIVSVTVNHPELKVDGALVTITQGDGDSILEPGETASILVTLEESGLAAGASNVTASLISQEASVAVGQAGPLSFGNLIAGGTAAGAASFSITVSPDAQCGSVVSLPLAMGADEGCWADGINVAIGPGPCDIEGGGFVRPVPGSLAVVADTGDADGIADNCEITTYSYKLKNVGDASSGYVTAAVQALTPVAPVLGGSAFTHQNLEPGEEVTAFFSVDMAAAEPASTVGFAVIAAAAAQSGPATQDYTVIAEEDAPAYSTLAYDFESGAQGWTAAGFSLSTARSFSGAQSFQAGSTTQPWLCQKLLSPVFRLDPAGASSLSMQVYVDVEPFDIPSNEWFDRGNIHLIDVATNVHTVIAPTSGILYNVTSGFGTSGQICHIDQDQGWAGLLAPFGASGFDLSAWAGRDIQLEFTYGSDGALNQEGIYVDDVSISAATLVPADAQPDGCLAAPEVSPPGSPVQLRVDPGAPGLIYSWEDLGPGFAYNLYTGTLGLWYTHGTSLSCGSAGVSCDGTTCSLALASSPATDAYFLVTATRGSREGPSGFTSGGLLRDPAQDTCAP